MDDNKMIMVKKGARSARGMSGRLISSSSLVLAGILLASCATESPSAEPGAAPTPVAFTSAAQCTQPATMISSQSSAGQLAAWGQACATRSQDSSLAVKSSVNALQNAAKLYFAAENYDLAAQNGAAAKRLLESGPSTQSAMEQEYKQRFKFDSAFVSIAPSLALGLSDSATNRPCGTQNACLVEGLEALEAVEFTTIRPVLNDPTAYYQNAAATVQTLNAKANAKLSETSAAGNVDSSLSILKSIISVAPAPGNEGLRAQATASLLDIAEASAARAMSQDGGVDSAIRYLTEAAQVAPTGDRKRSAYSKLGTANEARADSLLGNDDAGDDASGLASYCDGAKAYQLAADHSNTLVSLEAKEGYAYSLSQIQQAGSTACDATAERAVAAFNTSEQFRSANNLPGHNKYLEAYGALLNRVENYEKSAEIYQAADLATRGRTTQVDPTPDTPETPKISFAGGDARANSLLVLAVTRSMSDDASERAEANALFTSSQAADANWPTSFLEHGKHLAKSGDIAGSNGKLSDAIRIARGDTARSAELAEAYYVRSRNALGAGNATGALADGSAAVLTNSSNPAYKRQACLAALFSEKGGTSTSGVDAYCPSANQLEAERALGTEDLMLNAFGKYRRAQIRRRNSPNNSFDAFKSAEETFRRVESRADGSDSFSWELPGDTYTYDNVARLGAWASDACGSITGVPPRPANPTGQDLDKLFTAYGVASCDGR